MCSVRNHKKETSSCLEYLFLQLKGVHKLYEGEELAELVLIYLLSLLIENGEDCLYLERQ